MEKTVLVCLLNRIREVTLSTEPNCNEDTAILLWSICDAFADVEYLTPNSHVLLQVYSTDKNMFGVHN